MGYLKTCCNTLLPSPSFMEKLVRLDARIRKGIDAFKSDNKDPDISLVLQLLQKSFAISDLPLALSILSVPISDGTKLRAALGSVGSSLGYSRLNLAYVFHISSSKPKPPAKEEVEILRSLLKDLRHAVDLEGADDSGLTLIHKAAAFGIIDLVNDLCELGVSTTALDKDARTPLHLAVSAAHPWDVAEKLVRALAKAGPEILSPGWAPLTPPPKPVVFKALRTMIPKKNAKLSDLIDKLNRELNVASSSKAKGNEGKSKKIAQAALQDSALQSSAPPPGVIDNEAESSAVPVVIQSEEVAPPVIAQIEPLETLSSLSVMEIKDLWETSIRSNERRSEEMLDKLISSLPFDLVLDLDGPVPSASSSAPRPDSYRTDEALRAVVEEVLPDVDDDYDEYEDESDDDEPLQSAPDAPPAPPVPYLAGDAALDMVAFQALADRFDGLPWKLTFTKEAVGCWRDMPWSKKKLTLNRLLTIASGHWSRSSGSKLIRVDDQPGLELHRIKIDKGGRILFEIAVEFYPKTRQFMEMIRVWTISLDHKFYEKMIDSVAQSYRRSTHVREKLRLRLADAAPSPSSSPSSFSSAMRLPKLFKSLMNDAEIDQATLDLAVDDPTIVNRLPPASSSLDTYTLIKFYDLVTPVLHSVFSGLSDHDADFQFKVSPEEQELIMYRPPCAMILLGRSGTGKTTVALYRIWSDWLMSSPKARALIRGRGVNSGVETSAIVFITASRTLQTQVLKSFRKLQRPCLDESSYKEIVAAGSATYHRLSDVPIDAFPLFISSKDWLRMLDGCLQQPFFPRRPDGSIIMRHGTERGDGDGMDINVDLTVNEDDEDGEEEEEEELEEEEGDSEGGARGEAELADEARISVKNEVTFPFFLSEIWPRICSDEKVRKTVRATAVWQEIVSYIKGSAESMRTEEGYLSLEAYVSLGKKRAPNFSDQKRRSLVYPLFESYQKKKGERRGYDVMDLIHHIYKNLGPQGHQGLGVPIFSLYRDEVQDFTQGELLLDMRVLRDPNRIVYAGDTAQTISRGVGFRFTDIKTLFWEENLRRKEAGGEEAAVEVLMPEIMSLKKNCRTHQGILDSAALVVDMIKKLFPLSIDDLERESALFDGPPPLLLSSSTAGDIKSIYNDLLILIAGSDRSSSSVEFGAHQVIIVRSIEAKKKLPKEFDNAIVLTVPQAKGLEFDDVFLVDFFGDSDATDEWRCLSYLLENLKSACLDDSSKSLSLPPGIYKAIEITLSAREEGYVRPLEFERDKHSLLQEELKHLYTAITRAKNNVVIFDRDPKKCAAFFHLLKSLRMARVVESSLLVDGADAKKYGLSRLTVSSEAEWFKRAKNLQANKIFDMAAKAFVQAKEPTRAAVASAYAYMQVDEEEVDGGRRDWQEEKKDRLSLACLLLAAAQRSNECLAPIDRSLVRKWILSAANAMSQVPGDSFKRFAIDIFMSMKEIRKALRVAKQLKNPDRSLEAKLSLSLYQLNKDKSRLATPSMVSAFGIDEEARLAEEKALKDRLMLLQTAAKAYYGLKEHVTALEILCTKEPDQLARISQMCHQSWTDFPQVLMTMILNAKDSGKQHLQLISKAISMVRDAKTKPFLYETCNLIEEAAEIKRLTDPVGAAKMLHGHGMNDKALNFLLVRSEDVPIKWLSSTYDLLASILGSIRKGGLASVKKIGERLESWDCPDDKRKKMLIALNAIEEASLLAGQRVSPEQVASLSDRLYDAERLYAESEEQWPMRLHLLSSLSSGPFSAFKRDELTLSSHHQLQLAAQKLTGKAHAALEAMRLTCSKSSLNTARDSSTIKVLTDLEKVYGLSNLSKPRESIIELPVSSVPWSFATREPQVPLTSSNETPNDWEETYTLIVEKDAEAVKPSTWHRPVAMDAISYDLTWRVQALVSEYCLSLLRLQAQLHANGSSLAKPDSTQEAMDLSTELTEMLALVLQAIKLHRSASDMTLAAAQLSHAANGVHHKKCPSYRAPSAIKSLYLTSSSQLRGVGKALWSLYFSLIWSTLPPPDLFKSILPQAIKDVKHAFGSKPVPDTIEDAARGVFSLASALPARHPSACLSVWFCLSGLVQRSNNCRKMIEVKGSTRAQASRPDLLVRMQFNLIGKRLCLPELALAASSNQVPRFLGALIFYVNHNIYKRAISVNAGPHAAIPLPLDALVSLVELSGARIILGLSKSSAFLSPGLIDVLSTSFAPGSIQPPQNILAEWADRKAALRMSLWLIDACYRLAIMLLPDTSDPHGDMQAQLMALAGISYGAMLPQREVSRKSALSVRLSTLLSCLLMTAEVAVAFEDYDEKKVSKAKKGKEAQASIETPRAAKLKRICCLSRSVISQLLCSAGGNRHVLERKVSTILEARTIKALSDSLVSLCDQLPGKLPLVLVTSKKVETHSPTPDSPFWKLQETKLQSRKPSSPAPLEPTSSLPPWYSRPFKEWPYLAADPEDRYDPEAVFGANVDPKEDPEAERNQAATIIGRLWRKHTMRRKVLLFVIRTIAVHRLILRLRPMYQHLHPMWEAKVELKKLRKAKREAEEAAALFAMEAVTEAAPIQQQQHPAAVYCDSLIQNPLMSYHDPHFSESECHVCSVHELEQEAFQRAAHLKEREVQIQQEVLKMLGPSTKLSYQAKEFVPGGPSPSPSAPPLPSLNLQVKASNSTDEVQRRLEAEAASLAPHSASNLHSRALQNFQSFYVIYSGPVLRTMVDLHDLRASIQQRLIMINQDQSYYPHDKQRVAHIAQQRLYELLNLQIGFEQLLAEACEIRDWTVALQRLGSLSLDMMRLVLQVKGHFLAAFLPPLLHPMDEYDIATAQIQQITTKETAPFIDQSSRLIHDAELLAGANGRAIISKDLDYLLGPLWEMQKFGAQKRFQAIAVAQAQQRASADTLRTAGDGGAMEERKASFQPVASTSVTAVQVEDEGKGEKETLYEELLRLAGREEKEDLEEDQADEWEEVVSSKKGKGKGGKGKKGAKA